MIYRLPYFAQVSIIQQMKPYECFLLGCLSKKSKRLVQRSIKKTVDGTVINLIDDQVEVIINSNKNRELGTAIATWEKYSRAEIMDMKKFNENMWITLEYNGIKMKCRLTFDKGCHLPVVWCDFRQVKLVPLALQKAISDVFDISNAIQVKMSFSNCCLTEFPANTQVDHIDEFCFPEPDIVNERFLDRFLKRVRVKHSLSITTSLRFNPKSPIFLVDHLFLYQAIHLSRQSFLNFTGKSALIRNPRQLRSQDLIDFVKIWLNGKNTKLEAIIIVRNIFDHFDREKVLEQLDTMPWDPKRRDGRFKYPENTQTLYYTKDLLDCTQQVDIQRKHDGLLATITVTDSEFCFFVWHTPFARPGTNLPVTVPGVDQPLSYPLGTISF